jgi:PadR family transcriptional regulator, regulatory protein PadR
MPSPDLLPGTLFLLILRSLSAGPLHGYAIAKHIKLTSRGLIEVEEGSLYPALNRLVAKKWLVAEWGVSETNRQARFYRLTPLGRKELTQATEAFQRMVRGIRLVLKQA